MQTVVIEFYVLFCDVGAKATDVLGDLFLVSG